MQARYTISIWKAYCIKRCITKKNSLGLRPIGRPSADRLVVVKLKFWGPSLAYCSFFSMRRFFCCLSACLSVCLSVCLSDGLSVCLSVCLHVHTSRHHHTSVQQKYTTVHISTHQCTYVHISTHKYKRQLPSPKAKGKSQRSKVKVKRSNNNSKMQRQSQ